MDSQISTSVYGGPSSGEVITCGTVIQIELSEHLIKGDFYIVSAIVCRGPTINIKD